MSSLTNLNPAVDFELDKSAELYEEILRECGDTEETLRVYNEKFSYKSLEAYMKERISFGEYLEYRESIMEKHATANPPLTVENMDALIEDLVEIRENRGSNANEAQAMAELRPFNTTRVDKSHAQIVRELMEGQKHLIRLNVAVLNRRHQPSKLLRRVSKVQHHIRAKEEEENAIAAVFLAEAEKYEAEARALDNDEYLVEDNEKSTESGKEEEEKGDKVEEVEEEAGETTTNTDSPGAGEKRRISFKP